MDGKTTQSHKGKDEDFGLPQEEFKPLKSEGEKWFRITVVVIGLILCVGASIVYWFLYHAPARHLSSDAYPANKELENRMPDDNVQFKDQDVPTIHQATQKKSRVSELVEDLNTLAVAGRKRVKNSTDSISMRHHKASSQKLSHLKAAAMLQWAALLIAA